MRCVDVRVVLIVYKYKSVMEYFKSGLKSVLGAPQPGAQPTGAETVSRLIKYLRA